MNARDDDDGVGDADVTIGTAQRARSKKTANIICLLNDEKMEMSERKIRKWNTRQSSIG